RPIDEWIDSRRRHVERNQRLKEAGRYDGTFLVVNEKRWREDWKAHTKAVRRYFKRRSNFLETDITNPSSWTTFCRFLGAGAPGRRCPRANRARSLARARQRPRDP